MMPRNAVRAPKLWGCDVSLGSCAAVLLMRGKNRHLGWAWLVHREHAEPVLSGGLTRQAKEHVGVGRPWAQSLTWMRLKQGRGVHTTVSIENSEMEMGNDLLDIACVKL